ncbi:MAG TPA: hypothetical protein VKV74_15890 [Bryobacteraceae bacterium]|nr:hypothetical protein [Bryobacteraceae bacterium]
MQLKSYFSGTVEAAMELARKEMGEDALLVNARPAAPEARYLGAYEVVFGIADGVRPGFASNSSRKTAAPAQPPERPDNGDLAMEFAELKGALERMEQRLGPGLTFGTSPAEPAHPTPLYSALIEQDLEPALARRISEGAPIESLFETDSRLGVAGGHAARPVVAFVGPPGAGKTASIVKIAALYGLDASGPARILSADVHRIAAADQLRSLASLLGVGCEVAETPGALAQMLEQQNSARLVLIDTPGLSRADMEDAADLALFLKAHPDIDTHLVLPAFLRPVDMNRVIGQFLPFGPKKLLFTHVDETQHYGALISTAHRWSLPVSFLGMGQQIPDDLKAATPELLRTLILREELDTAPPPLLKRGATA